MTHRQRSLLALCITIATSCDTDRSSAACRTTTATTSSAEIKVLVPFAIPVGIPVAPLAPYFYSYRETQAQDRGARSEERAVPSIPTPQSSQPATRLSPLAQHCSACHSGVAPKSGLSLESIDALPLADRLRAIRAVASGRMPKGEQLAADEVRAIIEELTNAVQSSDVGGDSRRRRITNGSSNGAQSASGDASYKYETNHGGTEAQRSSQAATPTRE